MFKDIVKKAFILVLLFPLLGYAQSQDHLSITIYVEPELGINQNIEFSYTLESEIDMQIKYIPRIKCPNAPMALLEVKKADLKANQEYDNKYYSMKADLFIEPQECIASIRVIEPFEQTQEEKFNITTMPSMDIEILLCKDKQCSKKSQVYKTGERLFLDYKTEVWGIKSKANVAAPDASTQQVELPDSIILNQVGIYKITINSNADDYKDNIRHFEITVLENEINFNNQRICNADGKCIVPETIQNCPQDCPSGFEYSTYIYCAIAILLLIVIAIIIYKKIQEKRKWSQLEKKMSTLYNRSMPLLQ